MKNCNFLLVLFLLSSLGLFAQNREFAWTETPQLVPIPAEHQQHDAVITYHKQRYAVDDKWDLYYTVHTRVRLLTAKGLEDHARIVLPKFTRQSSIYTLDARTIKKNGTVVDLKQSDIKKLDIPIDDFKDKAEALIFSIPGAEVGDEVEMIFIIKNGGFNPIVYLQQTLPALQSVYEMRLPKKMFIDIVSYNGMVKPYINEKTEVTTYTWQMENLPGLGNEDNSIKALSVPYIFQVFKMPEVNMLTGSLKAGDTKWSDLMKRWQDLVVVKDKLNLKYDNFYNSFIANATKGISNTDTISKVLAIHDELNRVLKLNNGLDNDNVPLPAFIEGGEIPYYQLICLYIKVLEDLRVPYSMVFCKNRYNGPFDLTVPDMMQVDYYGFAVKDAQGNMYLLMPRTDAYTYCAGELPLAVQGTSAVIVNGKDATEGSLMLPVIEGPNNNRLRKVQVKVDLAQGTVKKTYQENLTGSYSLFVRGSYLEAAAEGKLKEYMEYLNYQRELHDVLDTISIAGPKLDYPYDFKLDYTLTQEKAVSPFEDGLYQLSFANWMFHNIEEPGEDARALAYYPVCGRKDQFKYYLVFDQKIELVNADNLNVRVVHPEHGAYEFTVKQVNPTVILLESNYVVSGQEFAPSELGKLKEINDAWQQASQTPLIFKVL